MATNKETSLNDAPYELHDRLLKVSPQAADIIVWLQGDQLDRGPKVVELYKNGFSNRVLLTGNNQLIGPETRVGENNIAISAMRNFLIEEGIPNTRILLDEHAMNTHEQAENVIQLAKTQKWSSVLLVASSFHQVRAFLTFLRSAKSHAWSGKIINQPVRIDWDTIPSGRSENARKIFDKEIQKIASYQNHVVSFQDGLNYLTGI